MTDNRCKKAILYPAAFFIPAIMIVIVLAFLKIYPFGDRTLMTADLQYQFIDFFSYMHSILFGNNDFSYTLSNNLGGNMAGLTAYYLADPFCFMMALFDKAWLPAAYSLVLIIACGAASLTMTIFLSENYGCRYEILIFGTGYGMSAYITVYFQSYLFLTSVILLPVIMLGLHHIIKEPTKNILYTVCLASAIIFNYYTGYMLCIFSLLYFVYLLFVSSDIKSKKKNIISFIMSSITAGGLSMFILLPAIKSLSGEKNVLSIGLFRTCRFSELFARLYTDSFNGDYATCLPNIYCGFIVAFLVLLYFFNKGISRRERISTGLFMLFILLNFYINTFNVAWHGFNQPIGFPYRYSFVLIFLMLAAACRGLISGRDQFDKKNIMICIIIFIIYSVYLIISGNQYTGIKQILEDAVIIVCLYVAAELYRKEKIILALTIIFVAQMADLSFSAYQSIGKFELASLSEYQKYILDTDKPVEYVKNNDDSLYRMEKYFRRTHNDAMMFNYNGLSHFSSSEKKNKFVFMQKLGFRNNGNWAFYNEGSTYFTDCLLGIKYVISQHDGTDRPFEDIGTFSPYKVYKNENALPLMFSSDAKAEDIDYRNYEDPFEFQESIADSISGAENDIFTKAVYTRKTLSDNSVEYIVSSDADGMLEVYFSETDASKAEIFVNDIDYGEYFTTYRWNIMMLGRYTPGTSVKIRVVNQDGTVPDIKNAYIYYENTDAVGAFCSLLKNEQNRLYKISSSHYTGTYVSSTGHILFTLPYESGWNIYVDGAKADTEEACGILMMADVPEGEHTIDMRYVPAGRAEGIAISVFFLLFALFAVIIMTNKSKNRI